MLFCIRIRVRLQQPEPPQWGRRHSQYVGLRQCGIFTALKLSILCIALYSICAVV